MRVSKFLSIISCVTFVSLLYVYQQAEIFRIAYVGQRRITTLEDLLDKNSILRYNIGKNTSLAYIGDKVSQTADFQMPDSYRLVRLMQPREGLGINRYLPKKENIVARLFSLKRQAEAKTIKP